MICAVLLSAILAYDPEIGNDGVGDLTIPKDISAETQAVLLIHGGGWRAMCRHDVDGIANYLRDDLGCAVYNIDYRLASQKNPWPACGNDCVKAADFMFSDAFTQAAGFRPKKIWIVGGSAGGHLTLWTALSLPAERVAGAVSISGIADPEVDYPAHPGMYAGLFGVKDPKAVTREMRDSMSVMRLIRPNGPKILLTHATEDAVVPIATAKSFLAAYRSAGNEIGLFEYSRSLMKGLTGHCIWMPDSNPHRLIPRLEREIAYFIKPPVVPKPQPVKSSVDITALYYPGTEHMPEWNIVEQLAPERKPLLGWYDEGDPENVDWQIKWASEHGISNFCVCWYWNRGVQRLDHWVNAFYRAKRRQHLKWYMMYANHNQPGAHSTEDQIAVTKFWIDNYFKTPEYYKIGGKPVVVFCTEFNLDRDFIAEARERRGETLKRGEGTKYALELSDRLAREAGLPGICWINMNWLRCAEEWNFTAEHVSAIRTGGFFAEMTYNMGGETPYYMAQEWRGPKDRPTFVPYDLMAEAAKKVAVQADAVPGLPFWPCIPTSYDDSVRAYQRAWVVHGFTAEKFRAICEQVKGVCDKKKLGHVVIAPINEWQEGSYIEPNEERGFTMYDTIRDVFCEKPPEGWPENDTPQSLGLPIHEYPPMTFATKQSWTFDYDTEGWYRQPFGCYRTRCVDGCLSFQTTRDNLFQVRQRLEPFAAEQYKTFRLRMRVRPNEREGLGRYAKKGIGLRLKWGTTTNPIVGLGGAVDFQESIASCPVIADGQFHEYAVSLEPVWGWQGNVDELWLEAVNVCHAAVDIDWMRFE